MKSAREQIGLSRSRFALESGLLPGTIKHWEMGSTKRRKSLVAPSKLARYCNTLVRHGYPWLEAFYIFQYAYPDLSGVVLELARGERSGLQGLDDLPHTWMRTNHSSSSINWLVVDHDVRKRVLGIVANHYSAEVPEAAVVERPTHVNGSDTFRVSGGGREIFLKKFRSSLPPEQLTAMLNAHRAIVRERIFPGCGRYLIPLTPRNKVASMDWVVDSDDQTVALAFPFLSGAATGEVTHFKGASLREIESVGFKLGQLNEFFLRTQTKNFADLQFHRTIDRWSDLQIELQADRALNPRIRYICQFERELLRRTYNQVADLLKTAPTVLGMTLHDLHPHNIFVQNERAVLIFDYDLRNEWPEVASGGFALHRMCREYVRRQVRDAGHEISSDLAIPIARVAATAFLEGYRQARGGIADEIGREGIRWAKAVNLQKLFSNLAFQITAERDIQDRSEEDHYREVIKFIAYLKELPIFESALAAA